MQATTTLQYQNQWKVATVNHWWHPINSLFCRNPRLCWPQTSPRSCWQASSTHFSPKIFPFFGITDCLTVCPQNIHGGPDSRPDSISMHSEYLHEPGLDITHQTDMRVLRQACVESPAPLSQFVWDLCENFMNVYHEPWPHCRCLLKKRASCMIITVPII